ncbi:UbiA prenyltransferase family protein [Roseburia inulinivorans]|jgi:decaprenyl-phosphate phosphoribosyltransferase|uniref:Prenyltransferase n=1 Tax=Roseburia inulinivorans TaxID=360807 RepID=A0A414LYN6_9FIRM|nr:UbiA prenyltransferase family protein [Roseburia inulinivorans]RHF00039.1 prenyltransferase [Roseburia inulinivorans]
MKNILKLLRVKHWIKNGLIFLPVIFNRSLEINDWLCGIMGMIAFSLTASAVYIINDIRDVEKDRLHDIKKNRPIASGEVSISLAQVICVMLVVISNCLNLILAQDKLWSEIWIIIYLMLNILYSFGLKDKTIVDVVILASGFVIRVLYGGAIVAIEVSPMLILTVLMFSLYMGLGKRRNEKRKIKNDTREVLKYYTDAFLDKNMYMCLTLGIVFYSIWSLALENMIYTVCFVVIICMRYNLIIERESLGDPVDVLLSDKVLIALVIMFLCSLVLILFFS